MTTATTHGGEYTVEVVVAVVAVVVVVVVVIVVVGVVDTAAPGHSDRKSG